MKSYRRLLGIAERISARGDSSQALRVRTSARQLIASQKEEYEAQKQSMYAANQELIKHLRDQLQKDHDEEVHESMSRTVAALEHVDIDHIFLADPVIDEYPYGNCDKNLYGPLYENVRQIPVTSSELTAWLEAFSVCGK